ncbi:hypothetical protein BOTCAL_0064g00110 [Botryotinia calthae]|uniref:Uncharacterized protein n=1 Tax=Botryotinia calthae TaxID=38488 RepID=A0A4Y8D9N8_9HELO|nr:hypothetical protein BOTCAL_0064g00110 [Botryotinia calthae]
MCRPTNVARYYCDNRLDDHRYEPNQRWDGCHNHENPGLRNQQFLETRHQRPCRNSLNPPLPTDICPDHRAEFGNADSNIIQNNIRVLLERLREAGNYRELATGAPQIREHAYFDVRYHCKWLDPNPRRDEQYTEYGDYPQHPRPLSNWGDRARVENYLQALKTLEGITIPNEINAEERDRARPDAMRCLLFQLYRAKIEYQRAWTMLNLPRLPDI